MPRPNAHMMKILSVCLKPLTLSTLQKSSLKLVRYKLRTKNERRTTRGGLSISTTTYNMLSVFREVAGIVAERCVHPESNRPYSVSSIEKLMKDTQYALNPNRSVKQQASDVVESLKARIPITRAKMKVQVSVGLQDESLLNDFLSSITTNIVEQQSSDAGLSYVCLIEPDVYRNIDTFVAQNAASRSFVVVERYFHEGIELILDSEAVKPALAATNETPAQPPAIPVAAPKPRGRACSTCGGNFADTAQYRDHFRSEWHRYNLKMKAKGSVVTDERSFLAMDAAAIQRVFESLE
ncbi:hypothetical protein AC1031_015419 [Aphanomyces cochlioides]|nr:hypothetical protein AC1031_015419 [Aphanomyces cochlioides]